MANERADAAMARITAAFEGQSTSLNNIAEDIRRIKDAVTGGSDTETLVTMLEEVATKAEAQAAALQSLDLENEPPTEPQP